MIKGNGAKQEIVFFIPHILLTCQNLQSILPVVGESGLLCWEGLMLPPASNRDEEQTKEAHFFFHFQTCSLLTSFKAI